MKMGAQMYTVRTFTQTVEDFRRTAAKIADIGYKSVQISAIGKEVSYQAAGEICKEHGLEVALTHCDVNRILHDTEALIREHEQMGCRYIGLGGMPEKYRNAEWIRNFAVDMRPAVQMIKAAGMQFMYHNHAFEFEKFGGRFMLDYLLEDMTPDELGITLDVYWLQVAGVDICDWLNKLSDRIYCVHLKDVEVIGAVPVMAPVMEGNLNMQKILKTLEQTCCEYALVEQDVCRESPFTCLTKSYQNLRQLGYQ